MMWLWRVYAWLSEPRVSHIYTWTTLFSVTAAWDGYWLRAIVIFAAGFIIEMCGEAVARSLSKKGKTPDES